MMDLSLDASSNCDGTIRCRTKHKNERAIIQHTDQKSENVTNRDGINTYDPISRKYINILNHSGNSTNNHTMIFSKNDWNEEKNDCNDENDLVTLPYLLDMDSKANTKCDKDMHSKSESKSIGNKHVNDFKCEEK